jgi:acetylornithine deacetylase/succinyl-diaminopimelate desuccinylase-like protein
MDTNTVHSYIDAHREDYLEDLKSFLRIPSISTIKAHQPDIQKAAQFVADQLTTAQMKNVHLISDYGNPLVYGEWLEAKGKPTVLIYGHYDVQPVDPINEWETDPFEPSIRDNRIFARGATDDKGQILGLIQSVKALMQSRGNLPVNVRFLIEGEEEYGGEAIEAYIRKHAKEIPCDAVLIADTHMLGPGEPSIIYGVRGILYAEIVAHGAAHDLHSGTYGGVAPNPLHALSLIITGLKGKDGKIKIPGLAQLALPVTDEERGWWDKIPGKQEDRLGEEMGVDIFPGEQEFGLIERKSARATLEIHGFIGGYQQEGAKTVIPAEARVKISLRLVPNQTPDKVLPLLEERVAQLTPEGVQVKVELIHGGLGMLVDVRNPYIDAARTALSEEFNHEAYFIREGGSIPIAPLFATELNAPIVFAGYGLAEDGPHAPNEHFSIDNYYHAIHGTVRFLDQVAKIEKK